MIIKRWLILVCAAAVLLAAGMLVRLPAVRQASAPAADTESDYGLVLADSDGCLYVLAVMENSTASSAGVEPGDVVTSLNGTPTDSVQAFKRLESQGASAPVIQLHRRGQPMTVLLKNP